MELAPGERIITKYSDNSYFDRSEFTLTNYRVSLISTGWFFKAKKGVQSMTLDSVDSAELVYWHRPFLIVLFLLSCALVFGMESEIGDIPYVERAVIKNSAIGVALFSFVGYFIFRGSKLTVVGFSQKFSMQAARSRDEGMRFVNELMRAKANRGRKEPSGEQDQDSSQPTFDINEAKD